MDPTQIQMNLSIQRSGIRINVQASNFNVPNSEGQKVSIETMMMAISLVLQQYTEALGLDKEKAALDVLSALKANLYADLKLVNQIPKEESPPPEKEENPPSDPPSFLFP